MQKPMPQWLESHYSKLNHTADRYVQFSVIWTL